MTNTDGATPELTAPVFADSLGLVNVMAADATVAYLLGRGLAAEIDDARFPDGADSVPAPHVVELVAQLTSATSDACNGGDNVALLFEDADDEHSRESIAVAITNTRNAREFAQRTTRSLAQLALGVTSQLGWNDAIALAERAAVMVLHPPEERVVSLVEDGLVLHARHDPELLTELCGALCRMIIDHNCELELRTTGLTPRAIVLRVDAVGNLEAATTADSSEVDDLLELDWELGDADGELCAAWDDPLSVVDPARLALSTLQRLASAPIAANLVAKVARSPREL